MQPSYAACAGRASIVKFTACVTDCLASSVRLAIIMSFQILPSPFVASILCNALRN